MTDNLKKLVAKVKESYDIADYVESRGIQLKDSGNRLIGLCPFHNDKTPSMNVSRGFQNYKCFSCDASGDIINFVCELDNLSFVDALVQLAEGKGISVEKYQKTLNTSENTSNLKEALKIAEDFFVENFKILPDSHPAIVEITKRGLKREGFNYGYAPKGNLLIEELKKRKVSPSTAIEAGLINKSKNGKMFDKWQNRLMFFIKDISGNTVGFSGRILDDSDFGGKYVNSPATPLFQKNSLLFNLSEARKFLRENDNTLYVVEGQFDVIALHNSGIKSVVASSGTAFTNKQVGICNRIVGEKGKIVFCFDNDEAGKKALLSVFEETSKIHEKIYVSSLGEKDPCDYRLKNGSEKLVEKISQHKPIVEHVLKLFLSKGVSNVADKRKRLSEVSQALSKVSDKALLYFYSEKVANVLGLATSVLMEEVEKARESKIPLRSATKESKKESFIAELSDLEEDFIRKFDKGEVLERCSLNFLYLCFENRDLLKEKALKHKSIFPSIISDIIDEFYNNENFIPESSKYTALVNKTASIQDFKMLSLMKDEDIIYVAKNLLLEIREIVTKNELLKFRSSLGEINTVKELEKIILTEDEIEKRMDIPF